MSRVFSVGLPSPDAQLLYHWRLRLLNRLLWVLAVVGFVTLIGARWSDYKALGEDAIPLMIIDVAGVPAFDTLVAQSLIRTAQALELIGCQAAITGISPAMAQTITSLGLQMESITIARSPQEVLKR
ncbi:STAS domain-containing protein [Roseiflexus castenholzii]|jgi:hypothetical protein|uniref:Anti-sigma-factor antagonist n=1 Tax=Roseiflexus castenholzii (strain DSM 13941 / HLO8) TaxID=383372 RepID=A7NML4_ROSCS|nr:STAS domain-containing protein [Roseiflexus castenholzii]ABU58785.1 anti-sigma-factor antagonist [Roseiflexus castenholzii DSM 13941]